jgi:glycosyltransferase involved in cell wall biosynthesis
MNPEYVIAGSWWWKLTRKRIVFWYMHKSVTARLKLAEQLADVIVTASPESFRLPSKKLHVVGHGINTDLFRPDARVVRGTHALSVGRLDKSKCHDKAIDIATGLGIELRIAGEGPERERLEEYAKSNNARVVLLGGLTQEKLRDEYLRAALLIHTSETGSLDKVLLEAAACGTPIKTEYEVYKQYEPQSYKVLIPKIVALCTSSH